MEECQGFGKREQSEIVARGMGECVDWEKQVWLRMLYAYEVHMQPIQRDWMLFSVFSCGGPYLLEKTELCLTTVGVSPRNY